MPFNGLLYFNTIKYLKLFQIYNRLMRRFAFSVPILTRFPQRRSVDGTVVIGPLKSPSMIGLNTFRFQNVTDVICDETDWNALGDSELWRYHLHYFDDLNAEGAANRSEWHREFFGRWLAMNPPKKAPAWDAYPTSIRIVNWIKYFQRYPIPDELLLSLKVQLLWLRRNVEWHLMANHLMANAKALVFGGLLFDGDDADDILLSGLEIIDRQLDEQILPDGGHFELSPMYHSIILEDLLDLISIAKLYKHPAVIDRCETWTKIVIRMLRWLKAMTHPDGSLAHFNDTSQKVASTYQELARYASDLEINVYMSTGKVFLELLDSGFARVQLNNLVLIMDFGAVGPDYQPGHSHADTLSFELSLGGSRVFVNTGISCYGMSARRSYERGTNAHNTVCVDGFDSSEVWSGFRVARRARVCKLQSGVEAGKVTVTAAHDGYKRLWQGPVHERSWTITDESIIIKDTLDKPTRPAVAQFLVHPDFKIEADKDGVFRILKPGKVELVVLMPGGKIVESYYAPEFGVILPTQKLICPLVEGQLKTELRVGRTFQR